MTHLLSSPSDDDFSRNETFLYIFHFKFPKNKRKNHENFLGIHENVLVGQVSLLLWKSQSERILGVSPVRFLSDKCGCFLRILCRREIFCLFDGGRMGDSHLATSLERPGATVARRGFFRQVVLVSSVAGNRKFGNPLAVIASRNEGRKSV